MIYYLNILEIFFKIFSIIGVCILVWYTIETFKIRRNSDLQLKYNIRPYLNFLQDQNGITIKNLSKHIAINIFVFIRQDNGNYQLSNDLENPSALAEGGKSSFVRNQFKDYSSKKIKREIPEIERLIDYLEKEKQHCLCVVYEDLNGNKLFTTVNGSGDFFDKIGKTDYLINLK